MMVSVTVESFIDITCPWCFIGKRRLEQAIEQDRGAYAVSVSWHPFQLHPDLSQSGTEWSVCRVTKFGSHERAEDHDARATVAGRSAGLKLALDRIRRVPNTWDAHRLIWLAGQKGVQSDVVEALFRAYLVEGCDLAERELLLQTAALGGLDRDRAASLLAGNDGVEELHSEERYARRLGVRSIPFMLFNGRLYVTGSQPTDVYRTAFREVLPRLPAGPSPVCRIEELKTDSLATKAGKELKAD